MSMVSVHGPNTMYTTEGGGTPVASVPAGATATKDPTNGLKFSFAFPNPGARPAADFDWTFTGPGSPAAQNDKTSGTVTFTGAGAATIICTVAAGAGPPAGGTYTVTVAATAGTPRSAPRSLDGGGEDDGEEPEESGFDPSDHTVDEVKAYVDANPDAAADVYAAEEAGKARATLLSHLEPLVPYDPATDSVEEVKEYAETYPEEAEAILAAEREGKNRSTLVKFLENLITPEAPAEEDPDE